MKKKKIIKTIIAKVPKAPKFDLSFTKPVENTKILVALESLKTNTGWQFLTQVINANKDFLSKQIITKLSDTGSPLKEEEVDQLRFKYNYLTELLDKPDAFIKTLQRTETQEENLDPYASREDKP